MKVCVLYSGGKDSNLALLKAFRYSLDVRCLLSLRPKSEESYLFHYPNIDMVKLQSRALRLPLMIVNCHDDEMNELEVLYRLLEAAIKTYKIDGIVTGAIKSIYQASRFQKVCHDLDLWCFNPLWLKDEILLLEEILKEKFEVIFTRIAGYPLKKSLLGKRISPIIVNYFKRIRKYINPSGEGGEYETFVLDMPLFKEKIKIVDYEILGEDYDATFIIKNAKLVKKTTNE